MDSLPKAAPESRAAGSRTRDLLIASPAPYHYATDPHCKTRSKVLERLVLTCLRPHLLSSVNFRQFQSAERKGHSTETVLNRVYTAANDMQVTVLIGLDLSAAYDTANRSILLEWLQLEFGVIGTPLTWLQSYLGGRTQFVKLGLHQSLVVELEVGVPQRSIWSGLYCSPSAATW